jgi:hypothetical protein
MLVPPRAVIGYCCMMFTPAPASMEKPLTGWALTANGKAITPKVDASPRSSICLGLSYDAEATPAPYRDTDD